MLAVPGWGKYRLVAILLRYLIDYSLIILNLIKKLKIIYLTELLMIAIDQPLELPPEEVIELYNKY